MPELPEIETTLRGIAPYVRAQKITQIIVRHHGLRWPVPVDINQCLVGQFIHEVERRGKYLLLLARNGTIILHLGMSGSLRIVGPKTAVKKHDHLDIEFANKKTLRLNDPRRFGAFLWTTDAPLKHPLLATLGPEPLTRFFSGNYLWQQAQKRKVSIKPFIMNSKVVVGVGNIYAAEALFCAGIHPKKPVRHISLAQYHTVAKCIKKILRAAIKQGGTSIKNFVDSRGKPGHFKVHLNVYGRGGLSCVKCKSILKEIRLGQRSTVYCPVCQK